MQHSCAYSKIYTRCINILLIVHLVMSQNIATYMLNFSIATEKHHFIFHINILTCLDNHFIGVRYHVLQFSIQVILCFNPHTDILINNLQLLMCLFGNCLHLIATASLNFIYDIMPGMFHCFAFMSNVLRGHHQLVFFTSNGTLSLTQI